MGLPRVSCNTWKHKKNCLKLISFTHISSTNPFWWNKHIDTVCSHKRTDAKGATKPARLYLCMFYFSQQWAFYRVWTDKRDTFSFSSTSLFQFIQRKEISIRLSAPEHGRLTYFLCFAFFFTKPIAGLEVWTAELEIWIRKKDSTIKVSLFPTPCNLPLPSFSHPSLLCHFSTRCSWGQPYLCSSRFNGWLNRAYVSKDSF